MMNNDINKEKLSGLALGRKVGEKIIIDGNITVAVGSVDSTNNYVILVVDAPSHITVNRKEIQDKKDAENRGNR
jgi:carbon storage regulator CsrA